MSVISEIILWYLSPREVDNYTFILYRRIEIVLCMVKNLRPVIDPTWALHKQYIGRAWANPIYQYHADKNRKCKIRLY